MFETDVNAGNKPKAIFDTWLFTGHFGIYDIFQSFAFSLVCDAISPLDQSKTICYALLSSISFITAIVTTIT